MQFGSSPTCTKYYVFTAETTAASTAARLAAKCRPPLAFVPHRAQHQSQWARLMSQEAPPGVTAAILPATTWKWRPTPWTGHCGCCAVRLTASRARHPRGREAFGARMIHQALGFQQVIVETGTVWTRVTHQTRARTCHGRRRRARLARRRPTPRRGCHWARPRHRCCAQMKHLRRCPCAARAGCFASRGSRSLPRKGGSACSPAAAATPFPAVQGWWGRTKLTWRWATGPLTRQDSHALHRVAFAWRCWTAAPRCPGWWSAAPSTQTASWVRRAASVRGWRDAAATA